MHYRFKSNYELQNVLGDEYALIRNVPNELEKLKRLKNVIFNVQEDIVDQDFNDWLNEMKDAAYDAEDIIDTFYTEILRRRSNRRSNNQNITNSQRLSSTFKQNITS